MWISGLLKTLCVWHRAQVSYHFRYTTSLHARFQDTYLSLLASFFALSNMIGTGISTAVYHSLSYDPPLLEKPFQNLARVGIFL